MRAYWRKLAWNGMRDLLAEHAQEHDGDHTVFQPAKDQAPAGCPQKDCMLERRLSRHQLLMQHGVKAPQYVRVQHVKSYRCPSSL